MPYKIIDTHIHIWNQQQASYLWLGGDTNILNQHYYLNMLERERSSAGISKGTRCRPKISWKTLT